VRRQDDVNGDEQSTISSSSRRRLQAKIMVRQVKATSCLARRRASRDRAAREPVPVGGGDGKPGLRCSTGIDRHYASGWSVSAAGDVNGDSIDDLVIARLAPPPAEISSQAKAYVVFGSTRGFPRSCRSGVCFPPAGGDGSRGFVLTASTHRLSRATT
jgi:hypothetical protein